MISYRDIFSSLKKLGVDTGAPIIAHAALPPFGEIRGGTETVLGALLAISNTVIMPAFTYQTMVIPEIGPENNGIIYGSGTETNKLAEIFQPNMPVDPSLGVLTEALRQHPKALRSGHPILSFSGINAGDAFELQNLQEPLAPIGHLVEKQSWVVLMGVNQTANTSIHYAEWLAGRKQFTRWALTPQGIATCPLMPGCAEGFEQITPLITNILRSMRVGDAEITAIPLEPMVEIITAEINKNPLAFLCSRPDCECCEEVRNSVQTK
jgi:aminoglycoside 3-N-acetyltransferase